MSTRLPPTFISHLMAMAMPAASTPVMTVSDFFIVPASRINSYLSIVLNFTHRIDEFSFGNLYPDLINPLDNSIEISETRTWWKCLACADQHTNPPLPQQTLRFSNTRYLLCPPPTSTAETTSYSQTNTPLLTRTRDSKRDTRFLAFSSNTTLSLFLCRSAKLVNNHSCISSLDCVVSLVVLRLLWAPSTDWSTLQWQAVEKTPNYIRRRTTWCEASSWLCSSIFC